MDWGQAGPLWAGLAAGLAVYYFMSLLAILILWVASHASEPKNSYRRELTEP